MRRNDHRIAPSSPPPGSDAQPAGDDTQKELALIRAAAVDQQLAVITWQRKQPIGMTYD